MDHGFEHTIAGGHIEDWRCSSVCCREEVLLGGGAERLFECVGDGFPPGRERTARPVLEIHPTVPLTPGFFPGWLAELHSDGEAQKPRVRDAAWRQPVPVGRT